jgi:hypothetical protein
MVIERSIGLKFKSMSVGNNHVVAVTEDNAVYSWGNSNNYKLGHHVAGNYSRELTDRTTSRSMGLYIIDTPTLVEGVTDVVQVQTGLEYTVLPRIIKAATGLKGLCAHHWYVSEGRFGAWGRDHFRRQDFQD